MGGAFYDEAGRLVLRADITKSDYGNLFSARKHRLQYKEDEISGKKVVVALPCKGGDSSCVGQFYNVQSDCNRRPFFRDHLLEPD